MSATGGRQTSFLVVRQGMPSGERMNYEESLSPSYKVFKLAVTFVLVVLPEPSWTRVTSCKDRPIQYVPVNLPTKDPRTQ